MGFPVDETDRLLTTTRSVRRRLDLERDVPEDVLLDCIDIAEQAPTGGNQTSRRWLVIRDPATKAALADLYRESGGNWVMENAEIEIGKTFGRGGALRAKHGPIGVFGDFSALIFNPGDKVGFD